MVAIKNNSSVYLADVFKMDPDFLENEEKYKAIKKGELLDGWITMPIIALRQSKTFDFELNMV